MFELRILLHCCQKVNDKVTTFKIILFYNYLIESATSLSHPVRVGWSVGLS